MKAKMFSMRLTDSVRERFNEVFKAEKVLKPDLTKSEFVNNLLNSNQILGETNNNEQSN